MAEKTTTFYPKDIVKITNPTTFNTFNEVLGVTTWEVSHIKTPTRKKDITMVVVCPIKNGKKGTMLYQFKKDELELVSA